VVAVAAAAGTIVVGAAVGPHGAAAGTQGCTPATNFEAIIDDSGSMSANDPNRLRKSGMDLLLSKQSNDSKTVGAVEFGTDAASLFKPLNVGQNRTALLQTLDQRIRADNGSTDYNDGFTLAKAENPNAQARIFLTDGAHNAGPYTNGHQGGPRTYVVGLGDFQANPDDGARLQQIANDTGGKYYAQQDASSLQSTINEIDSLISCGKAPLTFLDNFTKLGQTKAHGFKVNRSTRSLSFEVSWPDAANAFTVSSFVQKVAGRKVAQGSARRVKVKKLTVTKRTGATFVTVRVRGLRTGGRLTFKVRAAKLGSPSSATTQISQRRSR